MANPNVCPHGVNKKKWSFDYSPYANPEPRKIVLFDSEACPDCLTERVLNLREAFATLLLAVPTCEPLSREREYLHAALRLYYADMREHFGPVPRSAHPHLSSPTAPKDGE